MKTVPIKSVFVFTLLISFFSCSKEQQVLNKLEGKWKLVAFADNGQVQQLPTSSMLFYTYDNCEALAESCILNARIESAGGEIINQTTVEYVLSENGTSYTVDGTIWKIEKLTSDELILSKPYNDEYTFEKQ